MLEYRKIKLLYRSALKEIGTKLEILNDEFKLVHQYNPIEHIESRLKTDESITRKLIRKGKEITVENIQKYILLDMPKNFWEMIIMMWQRGD